MRNFGGTLTQFASCMWSKLFFAISTSLTFAISVSGQTGKVDHSKQAIICLTYDDGLQSHLRTVLPQLDSAGLKGTFFLNSIQGSSEVIGETSPAITGWTNAALHGHELANHTLFHACPIKKGWKKAFATESYPINKIITEVMTENAILSLLDPNKSKEPSLFHVIIFW